MELTQSDINLREKIKPKRGSYPMVEDRPVSDEEWHTFEQQFNYWFEQNHAMLTSMEASMSQPNPPGYFRANND